MAKQPDQNEHDVRDQAAGDDEVDESKMSPMELLRHREAQGGLVELDPEEERKRQEFLAEVELRLSSGRTIEEIEELLRQNNKRDDSEPEGT